MAEELPRWDVSAYFPGLDSPELAAATERIGADVIRLGALYDEHGVRGGDDLACDAVAVGTLEDLLGATNELLDRQELLSAYVYAHVSTDSRDERAAAINARLQADSAPLRPLATRLDAWLDSVGVEDLVASSAVAADHAWALRKAARRAEHQMSEGQEELAAELDLTGATAWYRLYEDVSSQLTATVDGDELPMPAVRNLAYDRDPGVRQRAYQAEIAAWRSQAVTIGACLNGIKGQSVVLNRRRGWPDALAPALHHNAVSAAALEAMQRAVETALPDFRRYLATKARMLGHESGVLPWWDLFAPVGASGTEVSWADAVGQVRRAFASFSPRLEALLDRAVSQSWIDVSPRGGKSGGAFCMPMRDGESRVLLNFSGTMDWVSTLAHELGHAYHNSALGARTAIQRETPMALAETASIFCETVLFQSALAGADGHERLALLETDLIGATQVVVDIHSRFLFEHELCRRRERGPLAVSELCELMTSAQRSSYGPALDPDTLHPYMWAVKPHYYGSDFYNWPYTFGLLFGLGLYASYEADPGAFVESYDDLLSSTGMGEASELAGRFGIDVEDEAFWTSSLGVLRGRIDEFERLAALG